MQTCRTTDAPCAALHDPQHQVRLPQTYATQLRVRALLFTDLLYSCARLFSAALDSEARVWTFTSWGRPFRLVCPPVDKSSPDTTPVQVECGWSYAAILTASGDVLVYWPRSGSVYREVHRINTKLDEEDPASKAQIAENEPGVIPCHAWDLEGFEPVRLPSIPDNLPIMPLEGNRAGEGVKVVKIAGMDNNVIALTSHGHVLKYDMLGGEDEYRSGRWQYVSLHHFFHRLRVDGHG